MATIWRFSAHGLWGTTDIVHTLHFQTDLTTGDNEPSAADVLDAIGDHLDAGGGKYTMLYDLSESNVTYDRMAVVSEVLKPAIAEGFHDVVNHIGTNGTNGNIPPELCAYLKFSSDAVSKSGRGGVHSGPATRTALWSNAVFVTNSVLGTSLAALGTRMTQSFNNGSTFQTVTLHPVIYSRTRHQRGETPYTFRITSHSVSPKPRFLRTRYT